MKKFTKILFLIFIFQYPILINHYSFGQTDTLAPVTDSIAVPPSFTDTLPAVETVVTSTDTSLNNISDSILPMPDTSSVSVIDTIQKIDTTPKPVPPRKIIAQFDTNPLIFRQGEIISKLLQIINGTEKSVEFTIDLTYPGGWKPLTNQDKIYILDPGDTFFIPVRIVPQGKVMGNTKYLIYAYIINENRVPLAGAHFLAEKEKRVSWTLDVGPDPKIYLLNDETMSNFSVTLFNTGNEQIELTLDMSNYRQDRIALMDTNGRIIKKPFFTFNLLQAEDTTFYFQAAYTQGMRNYRLIDNLNYRPNYKEDQHYTIFAQSRESKISGTGSIVKGKKIDLIRLNDEHKVNLFKQAVLPMTMDANISNILVGQPVMNVLFNGATVLNNGAFLTYFTNTYFSSYFANDRILQNTYYNIGYYDKKFNLQVGNNVYGGLGISGNYLINANQSIGGFFARGPRLINANLTAYGLQYQFRIFNLGAGFRFSRSSYSLSRLTSDNYSSNLSYSFSNGHAISAGVTLWRYISEDPVNPFTKFSYNISAGYGGGFFKKRLHSSISGSYSPNNQNAISPGLQWTANHSSSLSVKKWYMMLNNLYQYREMVGSSPQIQTNFINSLSINPNFKIRIAPLLFYNIITLDDRPLGGELSRFHSRGIGMNYSNYDFEKNLMMGINFTAGYNRAIDIPDLSDYFFFRTFYVFRYRVWSGNFRYTYGSISPTDIRFLKNGTYPQSLGISINKQHQFRNPYFILDNNLTYSYLNIFKKHSLGYTPTLYYFTNSGWRFYITPGYYLSYSDFNQQRSIRNNNGETTDEKPNVSHSFLVNAGVRKEFGIPLFWKKEKSPTLSFMAFIDHNGNNKQDVGEVSLENVVIKLGEWETLTNEKGLVTFQNVFGDSTYSLTAFSLVDLNGYFPNIPVTITAVKDSMMFIPFVKGVKIHGNVYLDREKIAAGSEKPLDLSGIKITALNGKAVNTLTDGKGDFSFYVPFGKYVITMDERVLGDRFSLLQNNIELELDQRTESIFLTFYIVEKRRKITVKKFNGNGQRIEGSDTTLTPKPKALEELKKEEELNKPKGGLSPKTPDEKGKGNEKQEKKGETGNKANKESSGNKGNKGTASTEPIDKSQIKFKVQIGAYGSDVPSEVVEKIKSLPDVKESKTEEGLTRYTAGDFSDYESAQALRQELINRGISSDTTFVIIIADYKGRVFSADEAKELLKD